MSDTERAELDDAIEGRPELRAELESLRGAAATMAEAVSEQPPASLRARVLDTIATTPQEPALPAPEPTSAPEPPPAPVVPITAARRHRWVRWGAIAAAAAAVAIGVLVVSPFGDDDAGDHIAEVLEAPERHHDRAHRRALRAAPRALARPSARRCWRATPCRRPKATTSTSCGGSPGRARAHHQGVPTQRRRDGRRSSWRASIPGMTSSRSRSNRRAGATNPPATRSP